MRLQRGEVEDYDFDRMVVTFTMLNRGSGSLRNQHCGDGRS